MRRIRGAFFLPGVIGGLFESRSGVFRQRIRRIGIAANVEVRGIVLARSVAAPEPLERLDVIRSGAVAVTVPGEGQRTFSWQSQLEDLRPGEYVYVRAIQVDGGTAWSSPIFLE